MNSVSTHPAEDSTAQSVCGWTARYGQKHRWERLASLPPGLSLPRKVRIYRRGGHHVLNWWDPAARKNQSERVDGDLLAVLVRARQIDDRVTTVRSAGHRPPPRIGHDDLVARYLADLGRRADAGEVAPATAARYRSALDHYRAFCNRPDVIKMTPTPARVNREFVLAFSAFLAARSVVGNGRVGGPARPMRGQRYILDVVRGLYEWAADPDRGGLLPDGFQTPFRTAGAKPRSVHADPLAEPDVTTGMARDLVRACDAYQLRLFGPLLLFGLRASEPCMAFAEHVSDDWLRVPCLPDLGLLTKGRRDKRFPLTSDLRPLWDLVRDGRTHGLLYVRRGIADGSDKANWSGATLADLIDEYRRRCDRLSAPTAKDRGRVRDELLRSAGGLNYDDVQREFAGLARKLGWPRAATLKDLRHLFATTMMNAGMPDTYIRYLMGHAPGRGVALDSYTHLNRLADQYATAVRTEWAGIVEAVLDRVRELTTVTQS